LLPSRRSELRHRRSTPDRRPSGRGAVGFEERSWRSTATSPLPTRWRGPGSPPFAWSGREPADAALAFLLLASSRAQVGQLHLRRLAPLDVRNQANLGFDFDRGARKQLCKFLAKAIRLEEAAHFLREHPTQLVLGPIGLGDDESEHFFGQLELASEIANPLLGHEQRAKAGHRDLANQLRDEPELRFPGLGFFGKVGVLHLHGGSLSKATRGPQS